MAKEQYKIITAKLDREKDKELIEYLEDRPVSYVVREALKLYVEKERLVHNVVLNVPSTAVPVEQAPIKTSMKPPVLQGLTRKLSGDKE